MLCGEGGSIDEGRWEEGLLQCNAATLNSAGRRSNPMLLARARFYFCSKSGDMNWGRVRLIRTGGNECAPHICLDCRVLEAAESTGRRAMLSLGSRARARAGVCSLSHTVRVPPRGVCDVKSRQEPDAQRRTLAGHRRREKKRKKHHALGRATAPAARATSSTRVRKAFQRVLPARRRAAWSAAASGARLSLRKGFAAER